MKNYFLPAIVLFSIVLTGQNKIDSLRNVVKAAKADTNHVITLNLLSDELWRDGNQEALIFANKALSESIKLNYKHGAAEAYNSIGIIYDDEGNYKLGLNNYLKALKIYEGLGNKKGIAAEYNNIGIIYKNEGNHEKALENYLKALKIREEIKDKKGIGTCYNNIANIYTVQKNYTKALEFYSKSLKIKEELGDKKGQGTTYNNIGTIYDTMDSLAKALLNYLKALKLSEEAEYKRGIANSENNIGIIYKKQADIMTDKKEAALKYNESLNHYLKALKLREEAGNKDGIAMTYINLGSLYLKKGDMPETYKYISSCIPIYLETGNKEGLENAYGLAADYYNRKGDYNQAYHYEKLYGDVKDSILNKENSKNMSRMNALYDSEKKDNEIKLLNKDKEQQELLSNEEKKTQRIILFSVIVGLLLVAVFSIFLYKRFKIIQKQNTVIEKQKKEVEREKENADRLRDIAESQTLIVIEQKQMTELKQKEIIDSINYAKRIQNALLKDEDNVSDRLPPHFILFKPKDIISGDFYWSLEKQGHLYMAAADCTGHGVPGAMMSMLGIAFLNEINSIPHLLNPADVLNKLRERIIKELNQTGKEGENKDGMDISLVRLNIATKEMEWAGANNSIYMIVNGELSEIKSNKQPIGFTINMQPFTNHRLQLAKDTLLYLFTDGFADQFGGSRGKKFKYAQLKGLLLSMTNQSMEAQKEILATTLSNWKGNLEQVDDILIIGMNV